MVLTPKKTPPPSPELRAWIYMTFNMCTRIRVDYYYCLFVYRVIFVTSDGLREISCSEMSRNSTAYKITNIINCPFRFRREYSVLNLPVDRMNCVGKKYPSSANGIGEARVLSRILLVSVLVVHRFK